MNPTSAPRRFRLLTLIAFSFGLLASAMAFDLSDTQIKAQLLGSWMEQFESTSKAKNTYNADGSFITTLIKKLNTGIEIIRHRGKWDVVNKVLVQTLEESTDPAALNSPPITRDIIINFEEDTFKYESEDGHIVVSTRISAF